MQKPSTTPSPMGNDQLLECTDLTTKIEAIADSVIRIAIISSTFAALIINAIQ